MAKATALKVGALLKAGALLKVGAALKVGAPVTSKVGAAPRVGAPVMFKVLGEGKMVAQPSPNCAALEEPPSSAKDLKTLC
jgi:hypothetical protein